MDYKFYIRTRPAEFSLLVRTAVLLPALILQHWRILQMSSWDRNVPKKICLRTFQPLNRTLRCLEIWGSDYTRAQCKIPEEINSQPGMLLLDLSKNLSTNYAILLFCCILICLVCFVASFKLSCV